MITNVFTGRPARGIVNRLISELGPISGLAPTFPTAGTALAPLRSAAEAAGRADFSPLWAGQAFTLAKPMSAAELTRELAIVFTANADTGPSNSSEEYSVSPLLGGLAASEEKAALPINRR